jgi:hypothetical protein
MLLGPASRRHLEPAGCMACRMLWQLWTQRAAQRADATSATGKPRLQRTSLAGETPVALCLLPSMPWHTAAQAMGTFMLQD